MPTLEELGLTPDTLFATQETVDIELFPKTKDRAAIWVRFKKNLEYGEKLDMDASLFMGMSREEAMAMVDETQGSTIRVNMARQKKNKLVLMIVDWNLPGPAGKTIPWPPKYVERLKVLSSLDSRLGEYLEERADELLAAAAAVQEADPDSPEAMQFPLGQPAAAV